MPSTGSSAAHEALTAVITEMNPTLKCYLHHMGRQLGPNEPRCRLLVVDDPLTDSWAGRRLAGAMGRMSGFPSIFHIMGPGDTE